MYLNNCLNVDNFKKYSKVIFQEHNQGALFGSKY